MYRGQQRAVEDLRTTQGHVFELVCHVAFNDSTLTVTWRREDNQTLDTSTARIQIRGNSLWFLPATLSDSGYYLCRSSADSVETRMFLSVGTGPCPAVSETAALTMPTGTNVSLFCSQDIARTLGEVVHMSWWKDCSPMNLQGKMLRLLNVSKTDTGNYTCLVNFTYNGKEYTSSSTHGLVVNDGENNATFSFESKIEVRENGEIYGRSSLSITEVKPEFFYDTFYCVAQNSLGRDVGHVRLIQAGRCKFLTPLIVGLLVLALIVAVIVLSSVFKVDLVLACRDLPPACTEAASQDGKVYDAYVTCFHGDGLALPRVQDFALRVLPEVLEQQHGLKLFIRGRDESQEGEDHAVTADAVGKSRRVILVFAECGSAGQDEEISIPLTQNQVTADRLPWAEIGNVIASAGVKVIPVQYDRKVDYSTLPDSVQTIIKRERVLKWDPNSDSNAKFWKHIRYRMP
ncbi:interleukin-1 receptor type 1-like [Chanos chanos]|uniref:Interleukin-1 receptor type 1-like n=1 Tax=Chanos chanos TaxID=29144 RepID=A0A6J2VS39_CHACN|nr:interleukin-1 receptor type 1-like [Chanos chanos]